MKNLRRYIQGKRSGKDAHRIEFQAMKDPFLSEAIDGYDLFENNHVQSIDRLQKNIQERFQTKKRVHWKIWGIAASVLFCIGVTGFLLKTYWHNNSTEVQVAEAVLPTETDGAAVAPEAHETLPAIEPEIERLATDTLTIYHPKDKELIAAARMAEIMRWREEQKKLQEQEIADMQLHFMPIQSPQPNVLLLADVSSKTESLKDSQASGSLIPVDEIVSDNKSTAMLDADLQRSAEKKAQSPVAPVPQNGIGAYQQYLKDHLVHPQDDVCKDAKGVVRLRFDVDSSGKPSHIRVIQSLCSSADKEAIRLVQNGPKWTTGTIPAEISVSF